MLTNPVTTTTQAPPEGGFLRDPGTNLVDRLAILAQLTGRIEAASATPLASSAVITAEWSRLLADLRNLPTTNPKG
jgi:hypothetical protein